jgi:hypothetical protein
MYGNDTLQRVAPAAISEARCIGHFLGIAQSGWEENISRKVSKIAQKSPAAGAILC